MDTSLGKTRLSVNLNKVALIRNARGGNLPDLLQVARDCEDFGAEGITVHPRPDERHIRFSDIPGLLDVVTTEFNIEGNPTRHFLDEVCRFPPHQCTLVPDLPDALTSDGGWDTHRHLGFLVDVVAELKEKGIRVSLFIDPDPAQVEGAMRVGADRVELYTGHFAQEYSRSPEKAIRPHVECSNEAYRLGVGLNAGHDLNLVNLSFYRRGLPNLQEVSIGHALICDALYYGLANTIRMYRRLLEP
ncbi:MAG: pyridoxine 5'-phosphate synthase [Saprospiraceae bacterium]|nr:pyridoxine 5'-phosphate synthase [Saprospiraceae bacterium]